MLHLMPTLRNGVKSKRIVNMNMKQGLFGIFATFFCCSIVTAGNMDSKISFLGFHPVISLQGGYASLNAGGGTQRYMDAESDEFIYTNSGSGKNTGFGGVFLGAEHALSWVSRPGFFMQTGVEYNYFGNVNVRGINTVGAEPETSTTYAYNYNFKTQQVLGVFKLLGTAYERFHPYGEIGLGAAFNNASDYHATTAEIGSLNLTPEFNNQSKTQFSYSVGLGVDVEVNTKIRAGLGYRYSNFGKSSLENGTVIFESYQSSVPFGLDSRNNYANQLIARISYVG